MYVNLVQDSIKQEIKKDVQIKKFSFYGFFKNLKFFEPYLVIYLLSKSINLFQIGILMSIKEITSNVLEIPSGIMADKLGRKTTLLISFLIYIVSFVMFFLTTNFIISIIAMVLLGGADAIRSGTNKSMIYTYLEEKNWSKYKTYVYGKTRSYSNFGLAISSILSIFIILNVPADSYIFLISIIPYAIDFFLVLSYKNSLNFSSEINTDKFNFKKFLKEFIGMKHARYMMAFNALFDGSVDLIKTLIQPIISASIMIYSIKIISNYSLEENVKIYLAIIYFVIYITSAVFSRSSYYFASKNKSFYVLKVYDIILFVIVLLLALSLKNVIFVCLVLTALFVFKNLRKPLYNASLDDYIDKSKRATYLSVSSQITSLFVIVLSPILGYVADNFSMFNAVLLLAGVLIFINLVSSIRIKYINKN